MTNHFQILIVGGGNAGLSVAAQLLLKNKNLNIGIIEPNDKHYYQPAWTLVGAGVYDIQDTVRNEKDLIPSGASWIKDAVATFQPDTNTLTSASGTSYSYDILVVCPGIQLDWDKIKGLKSALGTQQVSSNYDFNFAPYTWEMIKNFQGGIAVFTNPPTAIKCGGAPHKIMYLACDYWKRKGILDTCDVRYISGASIIFGVPEYAETLKGKLKEYNIKTHFGAVVTAIDSSQKTITFQSKEEHIESRFSNKQAGCYAISESDSSADTKTITLNFDICHAVPPQSAPDFIKTSPLADPNNPLGYVEIDKHTMQHTRFPNVFALGDCTNAPCSKTGAAIRKQAPVVVNNILSYMNAQKPIDEYTGYSACPIPTQYGKLMLAEFDYTNTPKMTFPFNQAKPNWLMWILKTKVLPWLYWNRILKGKA